MALPELSGESFDHIGNFLQSSSIHQPECFLLVDRSQIRTEPNRSIILTSNSNPVGGVRVTYIEDGIGHEETLSQMTIEGFLKAVASNRGRYKLFSIRIN